ncbi:MAG TPA: sugar ABC transporter ATP-binding protein [Bauldia sp.]|nr:sugar ABC transporter ATP-binding protein [Bauldia sp.]
MLDRSTPLISLRKLDKRFPGTHALKAIDLDLMEGEVHAIAGENGAGKSTLIKLLTGAYTRTSGEILWQGKPVALGTPQEAIALGINAVHQEMVLCPHLTVAANMFLGSERSTLSLLNDRAMEREAQAVLDDIGFDLPAGAVLNTLTIGQQQLVAAARAATRGARFIIFDEPTGYLTRREAEQLFALIRRLHGQGVTIAYISHRLEEIFDLADRVSVLRDGSLVSTRKIEDTDEQTLIRDMVNRSIAELHYKEVQELGETLLNVNHLSGPGFADVSLSVRRGEIIGLYGLIGAGRSEFVQAVFGRRRATSGEMRWLGEPYKPTREAHAIGRGIVLVPESRRDQGLCLNLGVSDNINLAIFDRLTRTLVIDVKAENEHADKQIGNLRIATSSRDNLVGRLSGGNQQKVVIGKWLNHGAELFIFDEPTVGVDVGTKVEIYKLFADLLHSGAGIILISSYLPEVSDLSDMLHVFRRGQLVASHPHGSATQELVLAEAIGT